MDTTKNIKHLLYQYNSQQPKDQRVHIAGDGPALDDCTEEQDIHSFYSSTTKFISDIQFDESTGIVSELTAGQNTYASVVSGKTGMTADKQRIQDLEEEVRNLKAQLNSKSNNTSTTSTATSDGDSVCTIESFQKELESFKNEIREALQLQHKTVKKLTKKYTLSAIKGREEFSAALTKNLQPSTSLTAASHRQTVPVIPVTSPPHAPKNKGFKASVHAPDDEEAGSLVSSDVSSTSSSPTVSDPVSESDSDSLFTSDDASSVSEPGVAPSTTTVLAKRGLDLDDDEDPGKTRAISFRRTDSLEPRDFPPAN